MQETLAGGRGPVLDGSMWAVVTTGSGGYDRLSYRRVPIPVPGPGEVLLSVRAAGVNATDVNTRLGWYARSVTGGVDAAAADAERADGGWNGATPFPLIQGADCCGRVAAAGPGVERGLIGARVLARSCMRVAGFERMETAWLGTDFDGAFAQFVKVPAGEVFPVACDWSDAALAAIPCAYGTAENMIRRAGVGPGERVLVPGASGGVGSALVQLLARRGAEVIAVAARVLDREADPLAALGAGSVDVVIDNVGGPGFGAMPRLLRRGGRYATSGAIAGAVVGLDLRDLYLRDVTLFGCTAWDAPVFPDLVGYVERGEIRPLVAATYPLDRIAEAQRAFLEKRHVGKIVLIPPA